MTVRIAPFAALLAAATIAAAFGEPKPAGALALNEAGVREYRNGAYTEAERLFREALGSADAPAGVTAAAFNGLAVSLYSQARFTDAAAAYERALDTYRGHPELSVERLRTMVNYSTMLRDQGRLDAAGRLLDEVRAAFEAGDARGSLAAAFLSEQGLLAGAKGDLAGAERNLTRAEAMWEHIPDSQANSIVAWTSLGDLYFERRDYYSAETMFRKALESCERAWGPEDRRCAPPLNGVALAMARRGETAAPQRLFERALAIFVRAYGPASPKAAAVLNNLGTLAAHKRDFKASDRYLLRAVETWTRAYGPDHPNVASAWGNLGANQLQRSRWTEAEAAFGKAYDIDRKALGPRHPQLAIDLNNLAVVYYHMKRTADAEANFEQAIQIYEQNGEACQQSLVGTLLSLANLEHDLKRFDSAANLYKRALEIQRKRPPDLSADTAASFDNYARLARRMSNFADAQEAETLATRLRVRKAILNERLETKR
ncbi:MAG: tetratricopeptide repeat protein [Acidobacteria bacterium]|nr:tetratricopeptide repeat protein [Acidobacteriota bacterium]